jgi:UDP-N-acetylmuramoylalanine--D-glutamate ligase
MTLKSLFRDQSFYVVGLGKSGLSTLAALKNAGAHVFAWDDKNLPKKELTKMDIPWISPKKAPWDNLKALVLSPGIPHLLPTPNPAAVLAQKHGVPIICDVDLFFQGYQGRSFIGVTGSNGKSTTTSLTAHLLKATGIKCAAGGNLGVPAFEMPDVGPQGAYVVELSSFQLERIFTPALDIAIFLNISPNHLDRHGDMPHYQQAKLHIFDLLKPHGKKIIGVDDPLMEAIYRSLEGPYTIPVSGVRQLNKGVYVDRGWLVDHLGTLPKDVLNLSLLSSLKGSHNHQNIAASYAAARILGNITPEAFVEALQTFKGLPHRQEWVGAKNNIVFINDSKATTLEAATKSLGAFSDVYWIVGGEPKEGSVELDPIRPFFSHIERVYSIGKSAAAYHALLKDSLPTEKMDTLPKAVKKALEDAEASGKKATILLAPACASYDQYAHFEERGDHFRTLVQKLIKPRKKRKR